MRRITRFHANGQQLCCCSTGGGIAFWAHIGGVATGLLSAAAVLPKASPGEREMIVRSPSPRRKNARSILVISMSNIYEPVLGALALFACVTAFAFHRLAMPKADVGR
jgi:hypothetical protein